MPAESTREQGAARERARDGGETPGLTGRAQSTPSFVATTEGRFAYQASGEENGRPPADALFDGLFILLAGVLLITPGVMTDGVGFLLLLPPCRALLKRYIKSRVQARFVVSSVGPLDEDCDCPPSGDDRVIDAKVIEPDDDKQR